MTRKTMMRIIPQSGKPPLIVIVIIFIVVIIFIIFIVVSSEGALYVILPYDYPQPLFEHTPVLNNNFEY